MYLARLLHVVSVAITALLSLAPTLAFAQDWPIRPMTLVVPFAAGGPVDTAARIMAVGLSAKLGQQVIVENVGGAGGMLGASRVAKAAPDGYTFLHGNRSTHVYSQILNRKPLYSALTDFAPVAAFVENSAVLVVRKDFPARTLGEFSAKLRTDRGKLQFGSAGAGSASHVICVLLNNAIGVDVTHVPYRGTAPAMQDLIAGRIDYLCDIISTAIPPIQAQTVKPLAILSSRRSAALPDLATADEQGLKGFDVDAWNAFFVPKATPDAIVRRLARATSDVVGIPAVAKRLQEIGLHIAAPERREPDYVAKLVATELKLWREPLLKSGAAVQ
jgi:tripartite-type tricarboxylate transporter receptor subunit TctC